MGGDSTIDPTALHGRGISKAYGEVQALSDVDLKVRRGTVHGLVGQNGSGKSTLMKVIAGAVIPDAGEVAVDGEVVSPLTPRSSIDHGIRVIFQDFALFPNMTVAENLGFDGSMPLLQRVDRRSMREHAVEALEQVDLDVDPRARLGDLSVAQRQLVAIARTVSSDGRIILMDEPTAALNQDEIDLLLERVGDLSSQGLSFVFISHKLREVVTVADDVTVLRDGEVVANGPADQFDQDRIGELMTGGVVENEPRVASDGSDADPVLEARGLSLGSTFTDVDLSLYPGRVVGLAGVVGSARTQIGLAMTGLVTPTAGEVRFRGRADDNLRARTDVQYVPEDRLTEGLFLDWSIADNIVLKALDEAVGSFSLIDEAKVEDIADRWRSRLSIKTPSVHEPVTSLSGGNQQRVLLARALAPDPAVLVLNNPTVGVDIGSRADIHDLIRSVADDGMALLVISDEPAELLGVCDEILVVHDGTIAARRSVRDLDEESLLDLIAQREPA